MRLWSIHPMYLDSKGITACWREGLLARKVLRGETKGYKNHPQLIRFKNAEDPLKTIDAYLSVILGEARSRGYRFEPAKINVVDPLRIKAIEVTTGQLEYELTHLRRKLQSRDPDSLNKLPNDTGITPNPVFNIVPGEIEPWEII